MTLRARTLLGPGPSNPYPEAQAALGDPAGTAPIRIGTRGSLLARTQSQTIADALTAAADRGLDVESVEGFRALPGRGVTGAVGGRRVTVERTVAGSTGTMVGVFVHGREIGRIELVDRLRDDAAEAVRLIGDVTSGSVLLLTGDRPSVAADVADRTGIREVHADLLPEDKVRIVGEIEGHVLVVGDGRPGRS